MHGNTSTMEFHHMSKTVSLTKTAVDISTFLGAKNLEFLISFHSSNKL